MGTLKRRAYSTQRGMRTLAPDAAMSSISSYVMRVELAGAWHDARVGGEHAVDVGVDLAHVRAERGGERDGGGVGAAAAQGLDVLGLLVEALEPGDDRDLARVDGVAAGGRASTSMMRARPWCPW